MAGNFMVKKNSIWCVIARLFKSKQSPAIKDVRLSVCFNAESASQ